MGDDKDQTSNTAVETYPRFRRRGFHGPLGFSSGVSSREDVFFQVTLTTVSGEDEEGGCPAVRTLRLLYTAVPGSTPALQATPTVCPAMARLEPDCDNFT